MDWYYAEGNQQMGPVSEAQLHELEATGRIRADTLVWRPGLAMWSPYGTVHRPPPSQPPSELVPNRFCSQCGLSYPGNEMVAIGSAVVCANCKDTYVQRLREGVHAGAAVPRQFAGFWIRFIAILIDGVILWIAQMILVVGLSAVAVASNKAASLAVVVFMSLLTVAMGCFYEAYFVSSRGATPGKMALSLKVIRSDGSRPSMGVGVGRYFAKLISYLAFFIGFIMAGVDEEKRALHDRICDTRVVR